MRGARICYPRVPRLMREDHRRISPRCVTNRNSSCTISLDHTRHITLPAARLDGPPGTKLSQQAALAGPPGTKLSLPPGSAAHPVQNSPSKRPWQAHPVQNSPCRPARRPTRYKTLPASGLGRPTRYKTLPASPKTPISGHFSHAGRTFYRFRHQHDEQGEKSHAPTPQLTPVTHPSPNFACNSIA